MEKKWEFSVTAEDTGEILLEWYCDRHNIVTVGLDNTGSYDRLNWAIVLDGKAYTGAISGLLKLDRD